MTALLASFIAFVAGAIVCWFVITRLFRAGVEGALGGHPAGDPLLRKLAQSTCWAHAGMLDDSGYPSAAAALIMMSRQAPHEASRHVAPSGMVEKRLREKFEPVVMQGNLCFPNPSGKVSCVEHGESLWAAHIQCSRCLRVFHEDSAPATCDCGWPLLPRTDGRMILPSTGGRICKHCFADGGFEPAEVDPPDPDELDRPVLDIPMRGLMGLVECPRCAAELYVRPGDVKTLARMPNFCPCCGYSAGQSILDQLEKPEPKAPIELPPVPTVGRKD